MYQLVLKTSTISKCPDKRLYTTKNNSYSPHKKMAWTLLILNMKEKNVTRSHKGATVLGFKGISKITNKNPHAAYLCWNWKTNSGSLARSVRVRSFLHRKYGRQVAKKAIYRVIGKVCGNANSQTRDCSQLVHSTSVRKRRFTTNSPKCACKKSMI